ncbi:MAG: response regulator [Anaerolineae bacterium]
MSKPIRILIADDHAVVRKGLRAILAVCEDLQLVGEATDGNEAVTLAGELQPDVILMDLEMPHKDGIEAIQDIVKSNHEARILVLTSFSEDDRVFASIKAGAQGYLLKDSTTEDLLQAIRSVHLGQPALHPQIAGRLMREISEPTNLPLAEEPLTEREVTVLKLVARGLSNQEIALNLSISERTVSTHVSNILAKLHLANRVKATLYALKSGLAKLE